MTDRSEQADLRIGLQATEERDISEDDVLTFARLSGDLNPLHSDVDYAKTTQFGARIVHGAFQVSLATALLGMQLPGKQVLLTSVNARFLAPLFFPARVRVAGEVLSWNFAAGAGQVRVTIQDVGAKVSTAEIFVGFSLHERNANDLSQDLPGPATAANRQTKSGRRVVMVTGAAGALGSAIVAKLVETYDVFAVVNRTALPDEVRDRSHVEEVRVDLAHRDAQARLRAAVAGRSLFGIVHAAWPGAPGGGLLEADPEQVDHQVGFASRVTMNLAKVLYENVTNEGGRFVAISSTAASLEPQLPLAVYSLGKSCLEQVVRLLAPELSRKKISMNAIAPSFMHLGINRNVSERMAKREAATMPLGRLCSRGDVVAMVRYLLSDDASFVSGQILPLTGAKL